MKKMISTQKNPMTHLHLDRYFNGQLAVFMLSNRKEPIAELSIMNESIELAPNEFILKDYSENKELISEFLETEVISPTDRFVLVGSNLCPICEIAS